MNPWEEYASAEEGPWSEFQGESSTESKALKGLKGYGETALNMITGGVSQIPAGFLAALETPFVGPSKAAEDFKRMNAAMTYEPRTDLGKELSEKAGQGLDTALQSVADVAKVPMQAGSRLVHKAGLTSEEEFHRQQNMFESGARAGTELAANFMPIPGAAGLSALRGSVAKGRAVKPKVDLAKIDAPAPMSTDRASVLAELDAQLGQQNRNMVVGEMDSALNKQPHFPMDNPPWQEYALQKELQAKRENVLSDLERGETPLYVNRAGAVMDADQANAVAEFTPMQEAMQQAFPEQVAPDDYKAVPNQATIDEPIAQSLFDEQQAATKQAEMDEAFAAREQQLAEEGAFERQMDEADHLTQNVEQPLRQGLRVPKSQLGAVDLSAITGLDANSPAVIAERAILTQDRQRAAAAKIAGLDAYEGNMNKPEKVVAAVLDGAKDITKGQMLRGKTVTPGVNALAISTNNPVIKYAREKVRGITLKVDQAARQYLTDKHTGLRPLYESMKPQELVDAHAILKKGDAEQRYITRDEMARAGASEKVMEFVDRYYAADKFKLDRWNEVRAQTGKEPVRQRDGHLPSSWKGDYKKLVYNVDEKGNPSGVAGVITADSVWELNKIEKYLKKNMPNVKVAATYDRRRLGGNGNRTDVFSGVQDVLEVLAQNNPQFAQIIEMSRKAIREQSDSLYGANKHALEKKGVFGNEGNKPWEKDDLKQARDAFRSYFQYWEEGMLAHEAMPVRDEMHALLANPALEGQANAREYAKTYLQNATGQNVGQLGEAMNTILDAGPRAIGFGSSWTRGIVNQANKRAGQWAMGFGNMAFSALQFTQVLQTALPEMVNVAAKAGVSVADPIMGMGKTIAQLPDIINAINGKENGLSPTMRQAVEEAKNRGINQFSEFHDISSMSQSAASQAFDKVVDANRSYPETWTRSFVFFSLVNMLDGKLPTGQLFDVAYNATQAGMFDYALSERPMMYQNMGTVGQLAGSLQTFKHNFISQQARLMKEAKKGNIAPMVMSVTSMATLAGIMGIPFYQELDELVKWMTNYFGGEQKNIEQIALEQLPDWANRGVLTAQSGLNFQSRLSAANVLPESLPEAISPYAGMAGDLGGAVGTAIDQRGSEQSLKNLAVAVTPNSLKGIAEEKLKSRDGVPLDNQGRLGNPRTERDWTWRKLGINTLDQAKQTEQQWVQTTRALKDKDAQASIVNRAIWKIREGNLTNEQVQEYVKKYVARGGDPNQLLSQLQKAYVERNQTKQQRLQGIPSDGISSINRWKNYNEY